MKGWDRFEEPSRSEMKLFVSHQLKTMFLSLFSSLYLQDTRRRRLIYIPLFYKFYSFLLYYQKTIHSSHSCFHLLNILSEYYKVFSFLLFFFEILTDYKMNMIDKSYKAY